MQSNNYKKKRLEYEAREKAIRDHNQMMYEAKESGREEGIKIGEERGKQEKELELIFSMYQNGLPISQISSIVKINVEELEKIIDTGI